MVENSIKLKSGVNIPIIGVGTWQNQGESCKNSIIEAINIGYRHIDTAIAYHNHEEIGNALKEIDIPREDLFLTSKIWMDNLDYDGVIEQVNKILGELEIEYLDLCLIHWPNSNYDYIDTFKAFEDLVNQNKIRSVGVSNFTTNHLREVQKKSNVPIDINQVEFHPYLYQKELLNYCKENNITLTAYSPMGRGEVLEDEVIKGIAQVKGKTPSQIVLRWLIEQNIIVIPKSSSKQHLKENFEIFDFELSDEEIEKISNLNKNRRIINPSFGEFDK